MVGSGSGWPTGVTPPMAFATRGPRGREASDGPRESHLSGSGSGEPGPEFAVPRRRSRVLWVPRIQRIRLLDRRCSGTRTAARRCARGAQRRRRRRPEAVPYAGRCPPAGARRPAWRAGPGRGVLAQPTCDPIWKIATARIHARDSCRATPNSDHRRPISRRCAATVATHGV
jgi:hypothetical protein